MPLYRVTQSRVYKVQAETEDDALNTVVDSGGEQLLVEGPDYEVELDDDYSNVVDDHCELCGEFENECTCVDGDVESES